MKLQTKKVIAREFLILLFTFFYSAIVYFSIYPYNYFKKENINKILKKVSNNEKIADSLIAIFKLKNEEQLSFHQKLYEYIYLADHSNVSAGLGNIDKKRISLMILKCTLSKLINTLKRINLFISEMRI